MTKISWKIGATVLSTVFLISGTKTARADVGVLVYESVGELKREVDGGHLALIATRLCAQGFLKVRKCEPGEKPGVVIGKYGSMVSTNKFGWAVIPMEDHFLGVSEFSKAPLIVNGPITQALQIKYWREHLQQDIPALSQAELDQVIENYNHEKSQPGARLKTTLMLPMTLPMAALSPKNPDSLSKFRLIDPETGAIIPNGRWREMIGTRQRRDTVAIVAQTSEEDELKLIDDLNSDANKDDFNVHNNCDHFVTQKLQTVFSDFKMVNALANPADVFNIFPSPIMAATTFVRYARKNQIPYSVQFAPEFAGTRELSTTPKTIARGALVPDINEGKLAFVLKTTIVHFNIFLTPAALAANLVSNPMSLPKAVRDRNGYLSKLQNIASEINSGEPIDTTELTPEDAEAVKSQEIEIVKNRINLEQVRSFGTPACWNQRFDQFTKMVALTKENGLLSKSEVEKLGKGKEGKALPQYLEKNGGLKPQLSEKGLLVESGGKVTGLTRENILNFQTDSSLDGPLALKIMTAVINYDLVGKPENRRLTEDFDKDWELYLQVAEANNVRLNRSAELRMGVAACSLNDPKALASLDKKSAASKLYKKDQDGKVLIAGQLAIKKGADIRSEALKVSFKNVVGEKLAPITVLGKAIGGGLKKIFTGGGHKEEKSEE